MENHHFPTLRCHNWMGTEGLSLGQLQEMSGIWIAGDLLTQHATKGVLDRWVCLKMLCSPKPNGFADHYPY